MTQENKTAPEKIKKGSFLSRDLSFGKKSAVSYPKKADMNLYKKEQDGNSLSKVLPTFIFLAVAIGLLTKFGVVDRLQAVGAANKELAGYQQQLADLDVQLADFAAVREAYQRYTDSYKTEEEAAIADRIALLELVDKAAMGTAQVESVSISGDDVTIKLTADTLAQIGKVKANLEQSGYVTSAGVYNADLTEDDESGRTYVTASIVLTVAVPEAADEAQDAGVNG
jgi:Tfp pilus assembly protein PilN